MPRVRGLYSHAPEADVAAAVARRALVSSGPRIVGFSIFFARSPSWYAIARQAVAAVASSASVRSRAWGHRGAVSQSRPCSTW